MAPKLTFVTENISTEVKEDEISPAKEEEGEDDDDDDDDDNDGEEDGGEDEVNGDEDDDDVDKLFVSSSSLSRISFMLTDSLRVFA